MSELKGRALSKAVAEAYGIEANNFYLKRLAEQSYWLHEDSARCFELAIQCGIQSGPSGDEHGHPCWLAINVNGVKALVNFSEEISNEIQAARTAILQCLLKMKEQK